jgi:hypothetical protein
MSERYPRVASRMSQWHCVRQPAGQEGRRIISRWREKKLLYYSADLYAALLITAAAPYYVSHTAG